MLALRVDQSMLISVTQTEMTIHQSNIIMEFIIRNIMNSCTKVHSNHHRNILLLMELIFTITDLVLHCIIGVTETLVNNLRVFEEEHSHVKKLI